MTKLNTLTTIILLISAARAATYTPLMIAELFRHGARTPFANQLDLDYYQDVGQANLLATGERQHYLLGARVRATYPDLFKPLNATFPILENRVQMQSTQTPRTIQSAQAHLVGLIPLGQGYNVTTEENKYWLPPFEGQSKYDNKTALQFGFRPFPVDNKNVETDYLFQPQLTFGTYCPDRNDSFNKAFNQTLAGLNDRFQKVYKELEDRKFDPKKLCTDIYSDNNGKVGTWSALCFSDLKDNLVSYENQKGKYYPGTDKAFMDHIQRPKDLLFAYQTSLNDSYAQFRTTWLTTEILDLFRKKSLNQTPLVYSGYSAHDTTIQPFYQRLNFNSYQCLNQTFVEDKNIEGCSGSPGFASNLIFELSSSESTSDPKETQYFVRVLKDGVAMKVCDTEKDDHYCLMSDFEQLANKQLILGESQLDDLCGKSRAFEPYKVPEENQKMIFLIAIALGVLSLFFLFVCMFFCCACKYTKRRVNQKKRAGVIGDEALM